MIDKAVEHGARFWDVKNKAVSHVLDRGLASGKTLVVGRNPVTNTVTTAMRRSRPFNPNVKMPDGSARFIPIP